MNINEASEKNDRKASLSAPIALACSFRSLLSWTASSKTLSRNVSPFIYTVKTITEISEEGHVPDLSPCQLIQH